MPEELGPGLVVDMDSRLGILQITVYTFDSATVDDEGNVAFSYVNTPMAEAIVKISPPVQLPEVPFLAESDVEVTDRLATYFADFNTPEAKSKVVIDHIRRQMRTSRMAEVREWN